MGGYGSVHGCGNRGGGEAGGGGGGGWWLSGKWKEEEEKDEGYLFVWMEKVRQWETNG